MGLGEECEGRREEVGLEGRWGEVGREEGREEGREGGLEEWPSSRMREGRPSV